MLISKRRIVFSILCISLSGLLLLQFVTKWKISKANSPSLIISDENYTDKVPSEPPVYKCCAQLNNSIRTNVYFSKTHKTGGTTIQSILLRFAVMNSLDVMAIIFISYYWPFSDASIYRSCWTPNQKYHILAHHMRYTSKLKSYQYPDTSQVTILRNPVTLFQSIYTFFRMDQTTGMNFQQFLNSPKKPEFLRPGFQANEAYRGYNQMSVDLGFDLKQKRNRTAVDEFIATIDREFDLVMITEHMDESLVLLANLMGWPLEYVSYIKLNARVLKADSYSITSRDINIIFELNEVDALLYHHFLKKFRKCVRQYGEQKMNDQVRQLKMINERFKNRCVAEEVIGLSMGNLKRIEYKPKNQSDLECMYSIQVSPVLEPMVIHAQTERLQRVVEKLRKTNFTLAMDPIRRGKKPGNWFFIFQERKFPFQNVELHFWHFASFILNLTRNGEFSTVDSVSLVKRGIFKITHRWKKLILPSNRSVAFKMNRVQLHHQFAALEAVTNGTLISDYKKGATSTKNLSPVHRFVAYSCSTENVSQKRATLRDFLGQDAIPKNISV